MDDIWAHRSLLFNLIHCRAQLRCRDIGIGGVSVRLSVTRLYRLKTNDHTVTQFSLPRSPTNLHTLCLIRTPLQRLQTILWWVKTGVNGEFWPVIHISETTEDRHILQCVHKKQSQLLLAQRHQTTTKCSNFWHGDWRDNCESAYDYVFHLTCVMPIPDKMFQTSYILTTNKTVKQ